MCVCVRARVLCAASYEGRPESDGHAPALSAVEGELRVPHPCEEDEDLGQAARPLREASQAGGLEVRDTPSRGVEGAEEQSPRTGWLSLSCSPKRGEHPPPAEAWKHEVSGQTWAGTEQRLLEACSEPHPGVKLVPMSLT